LGGEKKKGKREEPEALFFAILLSPLIPIETERKKRPD